MDPPFSTLDAVLKYMRTDDQDAVAQQAMKFAFGAFFAEEQANTAGARMVNEMLADGHRIADGSPAPEAPYKYRRFAGGARLPRGRYFALADGDGDDGFTLECELRAYVDHERAGRFLMKDGIATRLNPISLRYWDSQLESDAIWLNFFDGMTPSPFVKWLVESGNAPTRSSLELALRYRLERVSIDGVIDLRRADAQQWLFEQIRAGLPGVGYYYPPNHLVPGLIVGGERPTASELRDSLHYPGHDGHLFWYPPRADWDGKPRDGSQDFFGLLPFLVAPTRGGSPITEAIGRFVQSVGAAGLVFPSARADVDCEFDERGELVRSHGWNFVDYRGAPAVRRSTWIIISPDSWWGLPRRTDVRRGYDGKSWCIVGTAQSHWDEFQSQQADALLRGA